MTTLHHLRALLAAATPGPWVNASGNGTGVVSGPECAIYLNVRTCEVDECVERWQADATLIAALRNHAELLLDVVEAAVAWRDAPIGRKHQVAEKLFAALAKLEASK